jgi:3-oxoacyl-[acyl-carrier-protein] synthase II
MPVRFTAEVAQFQGKVENFGPLEKEQGKAIRKGLKVMCRECQMGVAAAQWALGDAGLSAGRTDPLRTGITFGADYMISLPSDFSEGIDCCRNADGQFEFSRWPGEGMPKMSPLWLLKYLPNMPACHLAMYNDLRGPNNSLTMREAAANMAVAEAYQIIVRGSADVMVVGATGARTQPMQLVHAVQQEELAVADDPARASRPFDRDRTGTVLGEGAGSVVLEELGAAQARGATIYAELLAGASSAVAGRNLSARRDRAMVNVLRAVLHGAGMTPDAIGHLHAHGLSTRTCDIDEAVAINEVFAGRAHPLPVVAAKSYFGNLGAGSGMVELAASLLALNHGKLFATLNYESPDAECPLAVVSNGGVAAGSSFINLNVTPQGQASAVLLRQFR